MIPSLFALFSFDLTPQALLFKPANCRWLKSIICLRWFAPLRPEWPWLFLWLFLWLQLRPQAWDLWGLVVNTELCDFSVSLSYEIAGFADLLIVKVEPFRLWYPLCAKDAVQHVPNSFWPENQQTTQNLTVATLKAWNGISAFTA